MNKICETDDQITPHPMSKIVKGWVRSVINRGKIGFLKLYLGGKLIQVVVKDKKFKLSEIGLHDFLELDCNCVSRKGKIEYVFAEMLTHSKNNKTNDYISHNKKTTIKDVRYEGVQKIRHAEAGQIQVVRSHMASELVRFSSNELNLKWCMTPVLTDMDCEGAGEMFQVVEPVKGYFGTDHPTYLTVSHQLKLEAHCCAMGDVFSFAPFFRAEKSDTNRHLAESWMFEAELLGNYKHAMEVALQILFQMASKFGEESHVTAVKNHTTIAYLKAVSLLKANKQTILLGHDLSSDNETWLCAHFKSIVVVTDYPRAVKSFYMEELPGTHQVPLVKSFDILIPGVGEVAGGSERIADHDELVNSIKRNMGKESIAKYRKYLELRQHATVQHSGFGIGFDRLVMWISNTDNIKDVVATPVHYHRTGRRSPPKPPASDI